MLLGTGRVGLKKLPSKQLLVELYYSQKVLPPLLPRFAGYWFLSPILPSGLGVIEGLIVFADWPALVVFGLGLAQPVMWRRTHLKLSSAT
jgi:hypothetical protein